MQKEEIEKRLREIEGEMILPDFWNNKERAQAVIQEMQELKDALEGVGKYDKSEAILSIYAGAGGDDAEDFAQMLFAMYKAFVLKKGWSLSFLSEHQNDNGGYRNVSIEIGGKNVYGTLKGEYGVHRLVRVSPFNAKGQRHTSFALVEVLPKISQVKEFDIPDEDLDIQFLRSSGPGGQNVNKRETAVRLTHIPTGISVHVASERTQERNRDKALEMIRGKLFHKLEEEHKEKISELSKSPDSIEWGNQIRSYVLHPYKMVKDHRTNAETSNVDSVLAGDIDLFLDAYRGME